MCTALGECAENGSARARASSGVASLRCAPETMQQEFDPAPTARHRSQSIASHWQARRATQPPAHPASSPSSGHRQCAQRLRQKRPVVHASRTSTWRAEAVTAAAWPARISAKNSPCNWAIKGPGAAAGTGAPAMIGRPNRRDVISATHSAPGWCESRSSQSMPTRACLSQDKQDKKCAAYSALAL